MCARRSWRRTTRELEQLYSELLVAPLAIGLSYLNFCLQQIRPQPALPLAFTSRLNDTHCFVFAAQQRE